MRLRTRLQKLGRARTFAGCPARRYRRVVVLRTSTLMPDGRVIWGVDKPRPCTRCGDIPEQIIEMSLSVVGERNDAAESREPE